MSSQQFRFLLQLKFPGVPTAFFAQDHCTIESLQFGLASSRNAEELEGHFSGIEIGLQKTRETATFDYIYRKWYSTQKKRKSLA